jgi:hypothetical protein
MLIRFTKGPIAAQSDMLTCVRPDGSTTDCHLKRQGILPHEAFHFVIESALGWHDALFGQLARGSTLAEISAKLHGQQREWTKDTQGRQAESMVECLEAEQWGGANDPATFAEMLVLACRRRGVPPPDITPEEIDRVRAKLREFGAAWRPLAPGDWIERTF